MTFEVVCNKCGSLLYHGIDIKHPRDIIKTMKGKCKDCGVKLYTSNFTFTVVKND